MLISAGNGVAFEDLFFYNTNNRIYLRGSGLLTYEFTSDDGHEFQDRRHSGNVMACCYATIDFSLATV